MAGPPAGPARDLQLPGRTVTDPVRRSATLGLRWTRRALRRELAAGRLRLGGLPRGVRRTATLALLGTLACALLVIARAFGLALPGPRIAIPAEFLAAEDVAEVPLLAIVLICATLPVAGVALALATRDRPRLPARLAVAGVALLGVTLASQQVASVRDLQRFELAVPGVEAVAGMPASTVVLVGGWLGFVASVAALPLALLPRRSVPGSLVGGLVAIPWVSTIVTLVAISGAAFAIPDPATGVPAVLPAGAFVVPATVTVANIVGIWLVPLGLWTVVTWARTSRREIGLRIAGRTSSWAWLLPALVLAKAGWLILGYGGSLPATIGGAAPVWRRSLDDGPVAWLLAGLAAGAAAWWLVARRRPAISERGFRPAARSVVLGFSAATIAASLVLAFQPLVALISTAPAAASFDVGCATSWRDEALGNAVMCLLNGVLDLQTELTVAIQVATIVLALVAALWLRRGRRRPSVALFLLAVVAWVAPRIPDALTVFGVPAIPSIAPELLTLDTALTIVVGGLAVACAVGLQRRATPEVLALVLTVSTLLVHGGLVVPVQLAGVLFFVGLLFPVTYDLLFDSEALNRGRHRAARILEAVGLRAAATAFVALGTVVGSVRFTGSDWNQVGLVLFAAPFAAMLTGATITRLERDAVRAETSGSELATTGAPRPAPTLARGLGVAAAALALVVVAGGAADRILPVAAAPTASPAPSTPAASHPGVTASDRAEFAAFETRTAQVQQDASRIFDSIVEHAQSGVGLEGDADALLDLTAAARGAEAARPAPGCHADAARAYGEWLDAVDELAAVIRPPVDQARFDGAVAHLARTRDELTGAISRSCA